MLQRKGGDLVGFCAEWESRHRSLVWLAFKRWHPDDPVVQSAARDLRAVRITTALLYDLPAEIPLADAVFDDPLLAELVATRAFQRLKSIHFLGGIDYLLIPSPNGLKGNIRHTRYEHSLGVAQLALIYAQLCDLSFLDRRYVSVAALLHDLGHAPLSHSLEPVFKEVFDIEHHEATENILTGRVPLGREVYRTLRDHTVDVERILVIIAGEDTRYHGFFSGPINFDTIEGILRTIRYAKLNLKIPAPGTVVNAAYHRQSDRHLRTVDDFWQRKDFVYHRLIHSDSGILADYVCQHFMRSRIEIMARNDYYATEAQIFNKLTGLRQLLTSKTFSHDVLRYIKQPIDYVERRFFILSDADFFARDDRGRYQQKKKSSKLSPMATVALDLRSADEGNLFDESGDR